jgi:Transposase DDE domain
VLSYGHAKKIEQQLKREVKQLLQLAEQADARDIPDGMSIPRFAAAPRPLSDSATPLQRMAYWPKTPRGRKLYAMCKHTPEPVFGIIKSVMGYRQWLLRGLENVKGEWNLVTMSWNMSECLGCRPPDRAPTLLTSNDPVPIPMNPYSRQLFGRSSEMLSPTGC